MILRCPKCDTEFERAESNFAPFCSERCKLVDLGNWLDETYRIAGDPAPVGESAREGDERED